MTARIAAMLALATAGCGGPPRGDQSGTSVDRSGRFPILTSVGEPSLWPATPVFEVGGVPPRGAELGSARSVLLAADGRLIVVDPSYRSILEFDSTGTLLRRIGREGPGPGEYREPYSVAWLGDTLALLDPGNGRIGFFGADDRWLASWPVPRITGGQFVRLYRTPGAFWSFSLRQATTGSEGIFVEYSGSGPSDTIVAVRTAPGLPVSRTCRTPDGGLTFFALPFGGSLIAIPTGHGEQAITVTSQYAVAILGSSGDTIRLIRRTRAPVPVTDAEWRDANVEWTAFRAQWPAASCDHGEFPRQLVKPAITSMFLDDQGRLWVEVATESGVRFDVFDREGHLQGTVVGLPPSGGIDPSVSGDRIALVGEDSTEVPVVRVFRFDQRRPGRGPGRPVDK